MIRQVEEGKAGVAGGWGLPSGKTVLVCRGRQHSRMGAEAWA